MTFVIVYSFLRPALVSSSLFLQIPSDPGSSCDLCADQRPRKGAADSMCDSMCHGDSAIPVLETSLMLAVPRHVSTSFSPPS